MMLTTMQKLRRQLNAYQLVVCVLLAYSIFERSAVYLQRDDLKHQQLVGLNASDHAWVSQLETRLSALEKKLARSVSF